MSALIKQCQREHRSINALAIKLGVLEWTLNRTLKRGKTQSVALQLKLAKIGVSVELIVQGRAWRGVPMVNTANAIKQFRACQF